MKVITSFTEKFPNIQRQLINKAVLYSNGQATEIKALWDTGATGSCISKQIVKSLGLQPIGKVQIKTPSGSANMNKCIVDVILNNEIRIKGVPVMETEIGDQGIDLLIGMDIIGMGDFAVSNYDDKTQFSFRIPSQEHMDFTTK